MERRVWGIMGSWVKMAIESSEGEMSNWIFGSHFIECIQTLLTGLFLLSSLSLHTCHPNEKLKLVSAFGTWAPARCCHVAIYPIFIFIQLFLIYKFNNMNMIWWMRIRLVGKVFLFFSFLFNKILMKANNSYMAVMVKFKFKKKKKILKCVHPTI